MISKMSLSCGRIASPMISMFLKQLISQALDHAAERTSERDLMGEYNDRSAGQLLKHFLLSEKHVAIHMFKCRLLLSLACEVIKNVAIERTRLYDLLRNLTGNGMFLQADGRFFCE